MWPIPTEFVNLNALFWPLLHQAPVPYYFNFGPLHLAPITLMRPQLNSQNRVQLKCHAHQSVSMYEDDRNYCVCRKEKSTCLATLRWKRLQTIFFSFLTFPISFLFHSEKAKIWKKKTGKINQKGDITAGLSLSGSWMIHFFCFIPSSLGTKYEF